ncbi:MAG: hypothetical protein WDO19_05985 [Bacteroidota bacterium]
MDSTLYSFWNTFWGQMSIELIGGIIGSFIFLFVVLIFFRPKLKLSKFICVNKQNGVNSTYYFKFVNLSFFSAHEINIELFSVKQIPMGDGKFNPKFDQLTLILNHISHIPGRPFKWNKTPDNLHCLVIRCHENLDEILSVETNAIMLKISLKTWAYRIG